MGWRAEGAGDAARSVVVGGSEAPPLASRSLKLFSKMLAKPHADQFIRICHAATSAPGLTDRTHICAGTDVTHICAGTSSQTGPQTSVHGLCGAPYGTALSCTALCRSARCLVPTSRKGPQGTAVQSTALHGFPRYGKAPGLSAVPFGPRTLAAPGGTRSTEASSSSACTEAAALSAAPTGRTYGSRRPWWPSRQALEVSGGLRRFPDAP